MSTLNSPPVEVSELAPSEDGPPALTTGGPVSGVYGIWCEANEKWYIGISTALAKRANKHFSDLRKGSHHCRPLQFAWNKYGEQSFVYVVLERAAPETLLQLEPEYIAALTSLAPSGFNLTSGGDANLYVSEETKRLLSRQRAGKPRPELRGRTMSAESNAKRSLALSGPKNHNYRRKFSKEHLAKLSASHKGKRISLERRAWLSKNMAGAGNPNYGVKATKEKLEKMRRAALGKTPTPEARAKMAASQRGRKHSAETKEKIRAWHLGRKLSAETLQKIKETKRKRHELYKQGRTPETIGTGQPEN